jgi:hypothetical protein
MMAVPLFAENSYQFDAAAKIIAQGIDEKGAYLILDRTEFYPQGGGQPSDVRTKKNDFSVYFPRISVFLAEIERRSMVGLLNKYNPYRI